MIGSAKKRRLLLTSILVSLVAPATAGAQELEEVIVTATKREQNLQDVPASVVALSPQQIEQRGISQVTDLVTQVPGLFVGSFSGSNLVSVRGISNESTSGTEDSNVAIYIDGVYQPRTQALNLLNTDIASMEVLRGPQGTLYGRNATGGAINITTKRPADEFGAGADLTLGNYDLREMRGFVTGPLAEGLAFRLSVIDRKRDGYTKNLFAGTPYPDSDNADDTAIRGALRWQPSSEVNVDLVAMHIDTHDVPSSPFIEPPSPASPLFPRYAAAQWVLGPYRVVTDSRATNHLTQNTLNGTATWSPSDNLTVKTITAYVESRQNLYVDSDVTGSFLIDRHRIDKSQQYSQEINLNAKLWEDRIDLFVGGLVLEERVGTFQGLQQPLNNIPPPGLIFMSNQKTKSRSIFADATVRITDRFRVFGGARYTHDKKDMSQFQQLGALIRCPNLKLSDTWNDFSPRVGAQYDVAEDVMVYGQWQHGFKAGGFNALACNNPFNQETVSAFEAGLKSRLLDKRLTFNVSAFDYDYTNLQRQQLVNNSAITQNAARAAVRGIEVEVVAAPLEGLRLDVSASLLDAKYKDFTSCNALLFFGNCSPAVIAAGRSVSQQVAGNRLSRAPKYTISAGAEYRADLGDQGFLTFRGELYRSGEVVYREFDDPFAKQSGYTLGNAYVTYETASGRYRVRGFVKNIGDKAVITNSIALGTNSFNHAGTWAPPRTYGVELGVRY